MPKLLSPNLKDLRCLQMADFLPFTAPFWPSLRTLTLQDMNLSKFPEELAGVLVKLSYLDLAENKFARLPIAVTLLSKLQHLEIPRNGPLQLEEEDVDTLVALPRLHTLNISKSLEIAQSSPGWDDGSVIAFIAISKRLPLLKLTLSAGKQV